MWKIQPGHKITGGHRLTQNCDLDLGSRWLGDVHDLLRRILVWNKIKTHLVIGKIQLRHKILIELTYGQTVTLTLKDTV